MRAVLSIAAVLTLCACAGPRVTPQDAQAESALEVCYGIAAYRPENAEVMRAEATRRSLDCAPMQQAVAAKIQAESAPMPAGVNSIPMPARQNCTSYRSGSSIQTRCY